MLPTVLLERMVRDKHMIHIYKDGYPDENMNLKQYTQVPENQEQESFETQTEHRTRMQKGETVPLRHLALFATLGALLDDLLPL